MDMAEDFENLTETSMQFKGNNWEAQDGRFEGKVNYDLDYPLLPLPRKYDALLVRLFWEAGYRGQQLQTLALKLIFLSDIATACGRFINITLVLQPAPQAKSVSSFV